MQDWDKLEPRALALLAFERGVIDAATLWDSACRFERDRLQASHHKSPSDGAELHQTIIEQVERGTLPVSALSDSDSFLATTIGEALPPVVTRYRSPPPPKEAEALQDTMAHQSNNEVSTGGHHDSSSDLSLTHGAPQRYQLGEPLGEGGVGQVMAALDRKIGRSVALKTLRQDRTELIVQQRFLTEARITAQLEHPCLIPVYDMGSFLSGKPFYTMRIVKHRSLREVLRDPEQRQHFSFNRVISIFMQVCRGLAYAHSRGVIHRDLKPDNILLGDYGEVYVADWGVAKVLGEAELVPSPIESLPSSHAGTQVGTLLGTPGYMAPEQAGGDPSKVDSLSDLFSMGVILYEILTDQKPFQGKTLYSILSATVMHHPPRPRELVPSCALVLDDLCMKLLSKEKAERPSSAEMVANEVEAFLEGQKEKGRRREEAQRLVTEASEPLRRYLRLGEKQERFIGEARNLLKAIKPHDPAENKRTAWELQDQAIEAASQRGKILAEIVDLFVKALGHDPECREASQGLASLYYTKAKEAEVSRDEPARIFYESLVLDYDDGHYTKILTAESKLSLSSNPLGARVTAFLYQQRDRILLPEHPITLGVTPLEASLPAGRYRLVLEHSEFRPVELPVWCRRNDHNQLSVNLYTEQDLGASFVYIPAGDAILGGDEDAADPMPRQTLYLPDFAISRYPVTFGEYLAFINDLWPKHRRQVEPRLPRSENEGLFVKQVEGLWVPHYEVIISEQAAQTFCAEQDLMQVPVFGVDWLDALSYCTWKSQRDKTSYRLPQEAEWETFCKMRASRPNYPQPEPIGRFSIDTSPYGVCDLAGGVREWVADIHGELTSVEALRRADTTGLPTKNDGELRMLRGGAWNIPMYRCRATSRFRNFMKSRASNNGFRLAKNLSPTRQ
jgi:eukaryotic-like serine/threonine-protein kinase